MAAREGVKHFGFYHWIRFGEHIGKRRSKVGTKGGLVGYKDLLLRSLMIEFLVD